MYIADVSIYLCLSIYILSLISLSKYMTYYICHVIIIGHVSQYKKLTERHFSEKHVCIYIYIKKSVSACFCFIRGWMLNGMLEFGLMFSLRDDCECLWLYLWDVGCNILTEVDKIEIVNIDWVRNSVVRNS